MSALPWSLLPNSAREADDGSLLIGGCSVLELAAEYGTPLFIYDEDHLRNRCQEAAASFGDQAVYAGKAFLCLAMARLVHEEGLRIDVASGGELFVALAAGVPGERLVMHGNNKSLAELHAAASARVGRLVVDSFDEFELIENVHEETGFVFDVLVRVTPGIEAHTHHYLATGQDDSKFGFTLSTGQAAKAIATARSSPAVRLRGVHVHIGSQVFEAKSFAAALAVMAPIVDAHQLDELSMGGGLGVAYVEGEQAPTLSEYGSILREAALAAGLTATLAVEPGRSIVAGAAITVYTIGTIKEVTGFRTYVAVDGGMSDNPRPVLYGSGYETFLPRAVRADRNRTVRVVGKHCETGDVLVREGKVPEDLRVGDLIATPVTGAYGHSMGSNYNKVPRPPVVFARNGDARLVVARESYDDLIRNDRL
ncbi:MAG: diaminopimelate decarboxylase [Acidimicrobiia bacterium]|nr:diaminopimelate decarboxylase [Acidimicrobiia bacterium]